MQEPLQKPLLWLDKPMDKAPQLLLLSMVLSVIEIPELCAKFSVPWLIDDDDLSEKMVRGDSVFVACFSTPALHLVLIKFTEDC